MSEEQVLIECKGNKFITCPYYNIIYLYDRKADVNVM
jgi:hypothetical protein